MRKVLSAALIACMLVLLCALSVPAVRAEPITEAQGAIIYKTIDWHVGKVVGDNTFMYGTSTLELTGTFAGTATDVWKQVVHADGQNFRNVLTFTGMVGDKSGTLTFRLVGCAPGLEPDVVWSGAWTILHGTDDLENLRGEGTWGGMATDLQYSGYIEFE